MKKAAKAKDFELAAKFRNQLFSLQQLNRQSLFGDREILDASRDQALVDLSKLLGLKKPPRRIEGFDISHMQGTDTVASMVVFINGVPDKAAYRKFKMRLPGNDDFAHMHETLNRRLREDNRKKWGMPDLILIDGGKGQLQAAIRARNEAEQPQIPMIGLAKREEEIIIQKPENSNQKVAAKLVPDSELLVTKAKALDGFVKESENFYTVLLPQNSHVVKLLQRIRDESHRFAVSYHSTLKRGRQTSSILDEIPGIGPTTRKKLIRHFGSAKDVINAEVSELQEVLGKQKGASISQYLASYR
jgi:excinuclease ABC subunit C